MEVSCTADVKRRGGLFERERTPDGDRQCTLLEKRGYVPQRRTTLVAGSTDEDLDSGVGGIECDEGQHTAWAAREFNRKRDLAAAGRVEDGVDSLWCNGSDALEESVAVPDGFGTDRSQIYFPD